jgi:hypothetical protein
LAVYQCQFRPAEIFDQGILMVSMLATRATRLFLVSFGVLASALPAQSPSTTGRGLTVSAAFGPSAAARGVDASGTHWDAGIGYRAHSNGLGVRLELGSHRYGDVPVYTCLVQDAQGCYQTMRRRVSATVGSVSYNFPTRLVAGYDAGLYLLAGVGSYRSNRIATHYPDCLPGGLCNRTVSTMEQRDAQMGASGGIGGEVRVQKLIVFTEFRVHYAYRNTPRGEPGNDYFLLPFSIGVRF